MQRIAVFTECKKEENKKRMICETQSVGLKVVFTYVSATFFIQVLILQSHRRLPNIKAVSDQEGQGEVEVKRVNFKPDLSSLLSSLAFKRNQVMLINPFNRSS